MTVTITSGKGHQKSAIFGHSGMKLSNLKKLFLSLKIFRLSSEMFNMLARTVQFVVLFSLICQLCGWVQLDDIKCFSTNQTVRSNYSCAAKKYSSQNTSFTTIFYATKKITFISVSSSHRCICCKDLFFLLKFSFEMTYRKGKKGPYFSVINVKNLKLCDLLGSKVHPALKFLFQRAKGLSGALHPCPYEVSIKAA